MICSTFSRTPCQIGSLFQASLWASPSKPSISSDSVEVVEDQVLAEAQLVRRGDRQRVVDHVGRRVALGVGR